MNTTQNPTELSSSALVRHCDNCLSVTAIDLDNTPQNARAMKLPGQTVRVMDTAEVMTLKLEACKCGTGRWVTTHDGYTAPKWVPNKMQIRENNCCALE